MGAPDFKISLALLLSALVSILSMPRVMDLAKKYEIYDTVNDRKIHAGNVPRIGGIGIFAGFILVSLVSSPTIDAPFMVGGLLVFAVGLYDDFFPLSARFKLLGQVAAASIVVLGGTQLSSLGNLFGFGEVSLGWATIPFSVFAIVGVINAINMIDGMDGLAGGIVSIAATAMGYIAWLNGDVTTALLAAALVGSLLGFLKYNTYPARIFMGDSGSLFIGYCVSVLSIRLVSGPAHVSRAVPLILLAVPILDTLFVILLRLKRRTGLFSADKNHIHHRLLSRGLAQPFVVVVVYSFSYFLALVAILTRNLPSYVNLMSLALLYVAVYFSIIQLLAREHAIRQACLRWRQCGGRVLARVAPFATSWRVEILMAGILVAQLLITGVSFSGHLGVKSAVLGFGLVFMAALVLIKTKNPGSPFLRLLLFFIFGFIAYIGEIGRELGGSGMALDTCVYVAGASLVAWVLSNKETVSGCGSPLEYFAVFTAFSVFVLPHDWVNTFGLYEVAGKALVMAAAAKVVTGCSAKWVPLHVGGYLAAAGSMFLALAFH